MAINLKRPLSKSAEEKATQFEILEKKEGKITDKIKNTCQKGKEIATKGLKGGLVGSGAMAANGMVAGATGKAIGILTAKGIGGVIAATSAGAAVVSAVPVVAGFGAACLVGSAISNLVNKEK